jgi:hypothetical protein
MQQASDCDMVLAHDDDLVKIDGLGHDSVSGFLNSSYIALLMSAVTGNPRTRRDDESPAEVQHGDTQSSVC